MGRGEEGRVRRGGEGDRCAGAGVGGCCAWRTAAGAAGEGVGGGV